MPGIDQITTTTAVHEQIAVVEEWIAATNTHDLAQYLAFFTEDAVLDDPSVGQVFHGHPGVAEYFESYFIGYSTQTRLIRTEPREDRLHVEVEFTGDFPGGRTGGTFDIAFAAGNVMRHIRADLL